MPDIVTLNPLAAAAVNRGIARLDEHFELIAPDSAWRDVIDPVTLDVSDPHECPLGQVFGDYEDGYAILHLRGDREAAEFGFEEPSRRLFSHRPYSYAELTDAWVAALSG